MEILLENLKKYFSDNAVNLGVRGWYATSQMGQSDLFEYREMIKADQLSVLDNVLINEIESTIDRLSFDLVCKHPERKPIIDQAITAHKNALYYLSVPIFLIQADGIFHDYYQQALFISPERNKTVKEIQKNEEYPSSHFQMLDQVMPVYASKKDRAQLKPWTELNRHLVLHGESVDYGTHINSAKALSFLSCISQLKDPT